MRTFLVFVLIGWHSVGVCFDFVISGYLNHEKPIGVLQYSNQLTAYQLEFGNLRSLWQCSSSRVTSNLVIDHKSPSRYPSPWPIVSGYPLPKENQGMSFQDYLNKKTKPQEVFWVEADTFMSRQLTSGALSAQIKFKKPGESDHKFLPFLKLGHSFENGWHSHLVGLTQDGLLFAIEPFSMKMIWQKPIEENIQSNRHQDHSSAIPSFIRLSSGQWCVVFAIDNHVVFLNPHNGVILNTIRIPLNEEAIQSIVAIDSQHRGFVDKIYLQSSQQLFCLEVSSIEMRRWWVRTFSVPFGAQLKQPPIVTLGDTSDHVKLTQIMTGVGSGDSVVQVKDFHRPFASSSFLVNWQYYSAKHIASIQSRGAKILLQEFEGNDWQVTVLDLHTGEVVEVKQVTSKQTSFTGSQLIEQNFRQAKSVVLTCQAWQKESSVLVANPNLGLGWVVLELDYQQLGRSAWRKKS